MFEVNEIIDDLTDADGVEIAGEWFEDDVEVDDLSQLIKDFRRVRAAASRLLPEPDARDEVTQRIDVWIARFSELEEAGSGLTGRYSDDLDG